MTRLNGKVINKKLWSFDIETVGQKNKFLMGTILGDDNLLKTFWDKNEFIDYIFNRFDYFRRGYIYATNLNFDILALINETKKLKDIKPIIRGSQMLCVKFEDNYRHNITFVDSFNFLKVSVAKMGQIVNIPKLPHPLFLGSKPKTREEEKELIDYNIQDAKITYEFMKLLQNGFNSIGANLKITIASTSMDLFRRRFLKKTIYQPNRFIIDYLYNAYYGGRTEVIKRGIVKNLNYYDVNSLYPSVMINEYPDPNRICFSKCIKKKTILDYEGVAHVRLKSPNTYIPYLPYRHEEKKIKKLVFPVGDIDGYYTFYEIRKAFDLGYELISAYDGVIYFKTFRPFDDFIKVLYKLRTEYKDKGDVRELIVKLLMNSNYGKWAQKIDKKETILHVSKVTESMIKNADSIFRTGDFFVMNEAYKKVPVFVNPIFSIYTTAYARNTLFDFIQKSGKDKIYYYDTDSIFTKSSMETSLKLGELKKEFTIKNGILVKPKMYCIDDYVKCKGVFKLNAKEFSEMLFTKRATLERFVKFKEANKRGLYYNEIIKYDKFLDLEDNKRIWAKKFSPFDSQDSKPLII